MPIDFFDWMTILQDIKKNLKTDNLIIGTKRTLKMLKSGKLKKVAAASNIPEELDKDLSYYSELAKVEYSRLDMPNDELGTYCKKPFSISVIGLL